MGNIKSCCRDNISVADDQDERARILGDNCVSNNSLDNNSLNSARDDVSYGSMNNHGSVGVGKTIEQSALDRIYQKMAANVIDVAPGESMVIQPAEFIERQRAYQAKLNQIKNHLPLRSSAAKFSRNQASTLQDTSVILSNATSSNASISTAGANLTAFHQLNTTANSSSNISALTNNHQSHGLSNNSSTSRVDSPQHVSRVHDKRRTDYEPISYEDIRLINEISDRTVKAIKELKIVSEEPVVTCFKP